MMAWWTSPTRLPGHGGVRLPPSTKPGSSRSTTRSRSGRPSGGVAAPRGLYSSHVAEWRKARDVGTRDALAPRAKAKRSPEQVELERLRRRNERLEADLAPHEVALEITGKAHALLELLSESADFDAKSKP